MLNYANYAAKIGTKAYNMEHEIDEWAMINKAINQIDYNFRWNKYEEDIANGEVKGIKIEIPEDIMKTLCEEEDLMEEVLLTYLHRGIALVFYEQDNYVYAKPITVTGNVL